MGDASFSSSVMLIDAVATNLDEHHEISMNEPLVHGRYTFYQSSFQESGEGKTASILTAAYDPGQFLKYLGSIMICLGSAWMFYFRRSTKCVRHGPVDRRGGPARRLAGREPLAAGLRLDFLAVPAGLDGGRHKPLDSLAWETARMIGNRAGLADPETGRKLDATGLYLTMLLDWQGWDRPMAGHMSVDAESHAAYFLAHHPDKWDRTPLILVENLDCGSALGIAADQKYIALGYSRTPRSSRRWRTRPLRSSPGPRSSPAPSSRVLSFRKEGPGAGRSPLGLPGAPHGSAVGGASRAGRDAPKSGCRSRRWCGWAIPEDPCKHSRADSCGFAAPIAAARPRPSRRLRRLLSRRHGSSARGWAPTRPSG